MKHVRPFVFATLLFLGVNALFAQSAPQVRTQAGLVSGSQSGNVRIFKGVPFAAPPVGDLRWKAPQPVAKWSGVKACTQFPASPIQTTPVPFMMWSEEFITPPEPLSEDCLYLNVWTAAKAKEKLPVLVWIHGGALVSGSGACAVYDGEALAQQGIVYVSINYRLGVFGFFSHPELSKESGKQASGNYGFLDQIAALQWIQKNIAAFGGDPNNVTIAGQSAGSFSVNALVASPLAKGLFKRAIAQSGAMLYQRPLRPLDEAEAIGTSIAQKLDAKTLADLRKKSANEVFKVAETLPFGSFGATLDGYVLPKDFNLTFAEGRHNDVPLLAGWVTGDGELMGGQTFTAEQFIEKAKTDYGARADEFLMAFPANSNVEAKNTQKQLALLGFAAMSSHLWAGYNKKSKTWLYQFSHVPVDKPGFPNYGAFHTSEVPFALHTLARWDRPWTPMDLAVEKTMSGYWVNFVKTGNPNGPGLPDWKAHDSNTNYILEIGDEAILRQDLFKKEFEFLKK